MTNWFKDELGNGIEIKHGFAFKGEFFSDNGKNILITPGNFYEEGGFKFTPGKEKFYLGDFPIEYLCSKDDLVVAMTEQAAGLLGSTALVPQDNKFLLNQRIGLISFDKLKYDKLFLYYLFQTKWVRSQIAFSSSGSKVKHTSPKRIYDVKIQRPPISVQREIGKFLSDLDSKIEVNNKINQELESMAKTLYDYWFIQFDFPNSNGKPYKSTGGKMVYNKELKREIPENWDVVAQNSVLQFNSGYSFSSKSYCDSGNWKIITIKSVQENGFDTSKCDLVKSIPINLDSESILEIGDLLMSLTGNTGRICFVTEEQCLLNQRVAKIWSPNLSNYFLYLFFKRGEQQKLIAQLSSGSSQDNLSPTQLFKTRMVLPSEKILKTFENKINPMYHAILVREKENQKLSKLRDWLLPMLMNGQVTVGEAEEKLGMVAEESAKYGKE